MKLNKEKEKEKELELKLNEEKEKNKYFKSCYKFSSEDNLISIKIISHFQDIVDFHLKVKDTELFSNVAKVIYEYYPTYKETKTYFLNSGTKIDENKTLKENNIKDESTILLNINEFNN